MGFLSNFIRGWRSGASQTGGLTGGDMLCVHCNTPQSSLWATRCPACHLNPWGDDPDAGPGTTASRPGGRSGAELLFYAAGRLALIGLVIVLFPYALKLLCLLLVAALSPGLAFAATLADLGAIQASAGSVWGAAAGMTVVAALVAGRGKGEKYFVLVTVTSAVYSVAALAGWEFAARHWAMLFS